MVESLQDVQRHIAERVAVQTRYAMSSHELHPDIDVKFHLDHIIERIVFDLRTYIMSMPKQRIEVHRRWPADWWQAFKERWFPAWLLRRYPVKYERIDIDQQIYGNICPHTILEPGARHLEFMTRSLEPLARNHSSRHRQ